MKFFFSSAIVLFLAITGLFAQGGPAVAELTTAPAAAAPAVLADRALPAFPAGETLANFLATEVGYPELAVDYAIEGTVVLEVEVSAAGAVSYLRTVRPLFEPLDEAAVAAIERMPRLLPAVENGRPVARRMMIPMKFSLR